MIRLILAIWLTATTASAATLGLPEDDLLVSFEGDALYLDGGFLPTVDDNLIEFFFDAEADGITAEVNFSLVRGDFRPDPALGMEILLTGLTDRPFSFFEYLDYGLTENAFELHLRDYLFGEGDVWLRLTLLDRLTSGPFIDGSTHRATVDLYRLTSPAQVPLPAAGWLMLAGLVALKRYR